MSLIAVALQAEGRHSATCPTCERRFPVQTSHAGRPRGGPARVYCSLRCRDRTAAYRRRARAGHRDAYALLISAQEQEDAGQLSLVPDPLPDVPQLELAL